MTQILNEKPAKIIFHYNKKHNEDVSIPPWIIKFKGETHYISHMDIEPGLGFSTKESPGNEHTKATLQIKGRLELTTITKNGDDRTIARIF